MLESMYNILNERFSDSYQSWDHLVEFLGACYSPLLLLEIKDGFGWLLRDQRFTNKFRESFDPTLLSGDRHDHLGDMYLEKLTLPVESTHKDSYLSREHESKYMSRARLSHMDDSPLKILDPSAGTGRQLMAAQKRFPNGILFGVDTDIRALRIAYTNFSIHGISGYLLHADPNRHEIDIATESGRKNWSFANRWYSHMDELLPIEPKNLESGAIKEMPGE